MRLLSAGIVVAVTLGGAAAAVVSCSADPEQSPSSVEPTASMQKAGSEGNGHVGAVGLDLTIPGGEHFSTLSYTLKNTHNTYTGTYNITNANTISFVIGSVAADTGYSISISTTSDDGKVTCSFPAPSDPLVGNIAVTKQTTTVVNVNAQCVNNQGLDSGNLLVNAVQSVCPVWNAIVAIPENIVLGGMPNVNDSGAPGTSTAFNPSASIVAQVYAGQSAVIVGSATGPNQAALAFAWSSNGGTLSSATGTLDPNGTGQPNGQSATNQTIFTCPATGTGTYTITLILSDGPVPEGVGCDPAFTTGSVMVACQPAAASCPFGTGCGDGGKICSSDASCVPALFSVVVLSSVPDGSTIDNLGKQLPISIQTYSLTGPQGAPIPLPTGTDSRPAITLEGNNISEGDLTTSPDGRYLSLLGWNAPPLGSIQNAAPVVARIDSLGVVDTSTVAPLAFHDGTMATALRSAVSMDGSGFWMSGVNASSFVDGGESAAGGIYYVPFGSSSATQLVAFPSNNSAIDPGYSVSSRWLRLFQGQLYAGTDGVPPYMINVGGSAPPPTSGSPSVNMLPGGFRTWSGPTPSPYGFVMFDLFPPAGPDTMYIADDGLNPDIGNGSGTETNAGGLYKWSFDGTNWNQVSTWRITDGTFGADAGTNLKGKTIGFRGLAGYATGTMVTLMATTGNINGNPDSLVLMLQDNASAATAPMPMFFPVTGLNQVLRGVALTPQ